MLGRYQFLFCFGSLFYTLILNFVHPEDFGLFLVLVKIYIMIYLTEGVGDLVQLISCLPGPIFRLLGASGLVVKCPVRGVDLTSSSPPSGVTTHSTFTSYVTPSAEQMLYM